MNLSTKLLRVLALLLLGGQTLTAQVRTHDGSSVDDLTKISNLNGAGDADAELFVGFIGSNTI
ncbi:MAG TPA: hypothetical protein VHH73_05000, partial [Verrucomicrobiae bacterium]|nr:hypothetical protein [Verrucomicrobiae bacterium]